jgi:hypothetical protein
MSNGGSARDLSHRVLAVAVRLLASGRSEWGRAMQAELASLDDVRARRRYALGCTRAVLSDRAAIRAVAAHVVAVTFGAVALGLAFSLRVVGVRIQTIVFVLVLGILAWSGRRRWRLGPIADHRSARGIRNVGYAVLGAYIIPALASFAAASPQSDQSGVWMLYVALTLYLATLLFATAHRTAARPRTLRLMGVVTVAGLAAWWGPMLMAVSVRAHPGWALVSVAATVTLGLVIGTARRWPSQQAMFGALAAGVATCLLIFLAAQSTFLLDRGLAPDLGRVPGMTAAGEVDQNRAEAVDPYVAELLLGALLGAALMAATTASGGLRDTEEHLAAG